MKLLFFSRGKGWGHSVRDYLIADAIMNIRSDIDCVFSSSNDGINGFYHMGASFVIDNHDSIKSFEDIIISEKPTVIVSDEMIDPLYIANKYNIPVLFITNYMTRDLYEEINKLTNSILFANFKALWPKNCPQEKVFISGPIYDDRIENHNTNIMKESLIIPVYFSGSEDISIKLENILLIKKLSSISSYTFLVTQKQYKQYFEGLNFNNIIWGDCEFDSSICVCRAGLTTLCENASRSVFSVSIPYSKYINPLEETTALFFQKLGLSHCILQAALNNELFNDVILSVYNKWANFANQARLFKSYNGKQKSALFLLSIISNINY